MKKSIIILSIIIIVLSAIVGFVIYKNNVNQNPSKEEILAGIEEKDKIRNELKDIINGPENVDENYQIPISEAREKAIKIFNSLGEYDLSKDNVHVREVHRNGKKYYYVSSLENSLEIEINTGKITKINNVAQ